MFGARRATHDPFLMDGLGESMKVLSPAFGPIMGVAGTILQSQGYRKAGEAARQGGEYTAEQLTQNAGQQDAAAQRAAADERRRAVLIQSHALAVAAASGAGAGDPTVVNLIGNLAQEGAYREQLKLYEGEDKARLLRQQAASTRYNANQTGDAYDTAATTSLYKSAGTFGSSLFAKYARSQNPLATDMLPGQYSLTNRQYG